MMRLILGSFLACFSLQAKDHTGSLLCYEKNWISGSTIRVMREVIRCKKTGENKKTCKLVGKKYVDTCRLKKSNYKCNGRASLKTKPERFRYDRERCHDMSII